MSISGRRRAVSSSSWYRSMFFEDMGITYLGPIPGHNLPMLCKALKEAKKVKGPVLLHVMTTKGKGYEPAETAPDKFHGIGPFDIESGKVLAKKDGDTYTDVFGKVLCDEASRNPDIVAITAAMADGTGLARFKKHYPNRFFDVGIAEEHGVTFAAGLAAGGLKTVAVYSSFYRGGYDRLIHDVALQNLGGIRGRWVQGLSEAMERLIREYLIDLIFINIPNMTLCQ